MDSTGSLTGSLTRSFTPFEMLVLFMIVIVILFIIGINMCSSNKSPTQHFTTLNNNNKTFCDDPTLCKDPNYKENLLLRQGYITYPETKSTFGKINKPIVLVGNNNCNHINNKCNRIDDMDGSRIVTGRRINNKLCKPYIDKTKLTSGKIVEGDINVVDSCFMSPMSNDITDRKCLQMKFMVPKVYMGTDPYISGVDYTDMAIESPADVDQLGSNPLNNFDSDPAGMVLV